MDNRAVTLIGSNVGDLNQMLSVSKSAVPYPITVKKYNESMGGADLCNRYTEAYYLNQQSKFRFSLRMFFDVMDVAAVNNFIIYDKAHTMGFHFLILS